MIEMLHFRQSSISGVMKLRFHLAEAQQSLASSQGRIRLLEEQLGDFKTRDQRMESTKGIRQFSGVVLSVSSVAWESFASRSSRA